MPNSSSTAAATSKIAERLQKVVEHGQRSMTPSRAERLRTVQGKVADLRSRGLLRRRELVVVTTSDFERQYLSSALAL